MIPPAPTLDAPMHAGLNSWHAPLIQKQTSSAPDPSLVGNWRLTKLLGRGQWTEVYRAQPRAIAGHGPSDYALKRLRAECQHKALARAALAREVEVLRQVNHPHLPALLDSRQSDNAYLVFAYEQATACSELLRPSTPSEDVQRRPSPLAIPQAIWIARQCAGAIGALHNAGYLHGDVKPANLLVSSQGRATLIDLGFARHLETAECAPDSDWRGTPLYASPESHIGHDALTPAHDIYALGMTLYELLAGSPPITARDRESIAAWHVRHAAIEIRDYLPHAPARLSRLLRAMLARQAVRRPSVSEAIDWLAELEVATLAIR